MRFAPRPTVLALALLALAIGCSPTPPKGESAPPQAENLTDVAGMIRDYSAEFKKAPTKLADVARYETLYSRGYGLVKSGTIVVVWGVTMPLEGGDTGVIAYEKKVETEGGAVLLENGQVKNMTAAEFASAPKAGKK